MINTQLSQPEVLKGFKHATISTYNNDYATLVVTAISSYIPIDQFKLIFGEIGQLVKRHGVKKLIFDKRQLTVFHQPSMEWYFVTWKEEMFHHGLKRHVKLLPSDEVFRKSVEIGRQKIAETFPHGKFKEMEISYSNSLEEALAL